MVHSARLACLRVCICLCVTHDMMWRDLLPTRFDEGRNEELGGEKAFKPPAVITYRVLDTHTHTHTQHVKLCALFASVLFVCSCVNAGESRTFRILAAAAAADDRDARNESSASSHVHRRTNTHKSLG